MPKMLTEGMWINGYLIEKPFDSGAMAQAARAKSPTGTTVFFKQYKLPSVRSSWYSGYIDYQREIKRRVENSDARSLCYQFLDFFRSKDTGVDAYYQVFEYIDGGRDVSEFLNDPKTTWDQRVIFAKTFMNGMRTLHDQKIIHTDLKPQNLYLKPAPIAVGYILKLIDMDFAIMSDKQAPWHGVEGYVGTPLYFSPEHMRGQVPLAASDIFTCGLILYELLTKSGHPYNYPEDEKYAKAVMAFRAPVPELLGTFGTKQHDQAVVNVLRLMLSPDPKDRPAAKDVHGVLLGLNIEEWAKKTVPAPGPSSEPCSKTPPGTPETPKTPETPGPRQLFLVFEENGAEFRPVSGLSVGGYELGRLNEDFKRFYAREQFILQCSDGTWTLTSCPGTTNKTFVNGAVVHAPVVLKDGDVIAVGNEATKKTVLPIRVKLS